MSIEGLRTEIIKLREEVDRLNDEVDYVEQERDKYQSAFKLSCVRVRDQVFPFLDHDITELIDLDIETIVEKLVAKLEKK